MWDADQYLKFGDERTRPCRDLAAQIQLQEPRTIIDLGCGPGNSTQVLRSRFPDSQLTGLDSSAGMIAKARQSGISSNWIQGEIAQWAAQSNGGKPDLVFSNAALHWVANHGVVFPRLFSRAELALALQMPANADGPAQRSMRNLAASDSWRGRLGQVQNWIAHDAPFYYDVLAPLARHLDIWYSEYIHVLPSPEAIVEWYKGTGLRPYLDALSPADQSQFLSDYLAEIRVLYPAQHDGKILFPFRRLFLVAYH